jgi:hypothetical protein
VADRGLSQSGYIVEGRTSMGPYAKKAKPNLEFPITYSGMNQW